MVDAHGCRPHLGASVCFHRGEVKGGRAGQRGAFGGKRERGRKFRDESFVAYALQNNICLQSLGRVFRSKKADQHI